MHWLIYFKVFNNAQVANAYHPIKCFYTEPASHNECVLNHSGAGVFVCYVPVNSLIGLPLNHPAPHIKLGVVKIYEFDFC